MDVGRAVLDFYRALPFNYHGTAEAQARAILADNALAHYPLGHLLGPRTRVLDVGCGAGWFALSVARYRGCPVTGIDFSPPAIERAADVARRLGLDDATFLTRDLFDYRPAAAFDFVNSLGVLHHTADCPAALRHLCRTCVAAGGHLHVGLYHAYGRRPFQEFVAALRSRKLPEEEMYRSFRRLRTTAEADETHARSWFRDQVLHPHESQHTLEEVVAILDTEGMELVATSINRYEAFDDLGELFRLEKTYEELGRRRLREGTFFPGFFTFLARKRA